MQVTLSERELFIVINALNYAKNEWEAVDDKDITKMAEEADELETKLKEIK